MTLEAMRDIWAMYSQEIIDLLFVAIVIPATFFAGYTLGREHRQPRDARGRFTR